MTGILLRYKITEATDVDQLPASWVLYGRAEADGEWKTIFTRREGWSVSGEGERFLRIPLVYRNSEGELIPYSSLRRYRYFRLVITGTFDPDSAFLQFSGFELLDEETEYGK